LLFNKAQVLYLFKKKVKYFYDFFLFLKILKYQSYKIEIIFHLKFSIICSLLILSSSLVTSKKLIFFSCLSFNFLFFSEIFFAFLLYSSKCFIEFSSFICLSSFSFSSPLAIKNFQAFSTFLFTFEISSNLSK
jgi:hypothetical protein